MWGKILISALAVGTTAVIAHELSKKAEQKKREYEDAVQSAYLKVWQANENIKQAQQEAQDKLKLVKLENAYQQSKKIADTTYLFIQQEKREMDELYHVIRGLKNHRSTLFQAKKEANQKEQKQNLQAEINQTSELITQFYEQMNVMKINKENLYSKLNSFNSKVKMTSKQLKSHQNTTNLLPSSSSYVFTNSIIIEEDTSGL